MPGRRRSPPPPPRRGSRGEEPELPLQEPCRGGDDPGRERSVPIKITGKAYLAGPHQGAPLSLVVITPASPGPSTWAPSSSGLRSSSTRTAPGSARTRTHPRCLRRRQARHPLDQRQRQQEQVHDQPDQLRGHCAAKGVSAAAAPTRRRAVLQRPPGQGRRSRPRPAARTTSSAPLHPHPRRARAARRTKNPKFRAVLIARGGDANLRQATVSCRGR